MERKLATVDVIVDIQPIPNADFIEMVQVRNWQCVARKGEFKVGDLCVYAEIDSVFPDEPRWGFLKDKHRRIRTIKLRGQISQGIALPFSLFTEDLPEEVGADVTDFLGITKYDPNANSGRGLCKPRGNFPGFIPKTDEERVQNLRLHELRNKIWFGFEKEDGTSTTYYKRDGKFGLCSRNLELKFEPGNVYYDMALKYSIFDVIKEGHSVQGEIVGPGIQKNRQNHKEKKFLMFYVFDIEKQIYLDWYTNGMYYELDRVPFYGGIDTTNFDSINNYLALVDQLGKNKEGLVLSRYDSSCIYGKESFKIINNNYLLKNNE